MKERERERNTYLSSHGGFWCSLCDVVHCPIIGGLFGHVNDADFGGIFGF